jgi:hypothetical protein
MWSQGKDLSTIDVQDQEWSAAAPVFTFNVPGATPTTDAQIPSTVSAIIAGIQQYAGHNVTLLRLDAERMIFSAGVESVFACVTGHIGNPVAEEWSPAWLVMGLLSILFAVGVALRAKALHPIQFIGVRKPWTLIDGHQPLESDDIDNGVTEDSSTTASPQLLESNTIENGPEATLFLKC